MQVKPEDVPMQDFGSLRWVFCQIDLGLYTVVPFIHTFGPLVEACEQVKSGMYLIGLKLAELLKLGPDCLQL